MPRTVSTWSLPPMSAVFWHTACQHAAGIMARVTAEWAGAAVVMAAACFVLGLAGFGNGLVAMAFLPYFISPVIAIAVLTIYTIALSTAIFIPVRTHVIVSGVVYALIGTVLGTPI